MPAKRAPKPNKADVEEGLQRIRNYIHNEGPPDQKLAVLLAQLTLLLAKLKDVVK